jgi:hypothetical protein
MCSRHVAQVQRVCQRWDVHWQDVCQENMAQQTAARCFAAERYSIGFVKTELLHVRLVILWPVHTFGHAPLRILLE